jgi:sensor c-di-GMP phosphodiesterase-like protein
VFAFFIAGFGFLLPWHQKRNPVADLERALNDGEFIPYYQPIVDLESGRLYGAEVLMRWRKADGSLIAPAVFIPLAESSGMIAEMTRHLMRKVRDELSAAYEKRPQLRVGFNLAASHFADERVVTDVQKIFERSPIQYSQIVLELTERQPVENLTAARRVIAAMQGLGVKVAIDDVGAGHSGLSYMLKLGVDVIKIDKIFVDAMGSDNNSTHIIETLVDLANNMRMEIVAEGVENFEQAVALRKHGIRLAQGYLFAPPLPGSSFLKLVEAIEPRQSAAQGSLSVAA